MKETSFSVIIPTYKRPKMLARSLASVLCQLEVDDEVIVVNDDRLEGIHLPPTLLAFGDRLRTINNQFARGPSGARNFGVANSNRPYVMFLDDDDVMQNGYISAVKLALTKNPNANFGGANIEKLQNELNNQFYLTCRTPEFGKLVTKPKDVLFGAGCGMWVKRDLFAKVGGFDVSLVNSEDNDLCARLVGNGAKCLKFSDAWIYVYSGHSHEHQNITSVVSMDEKVKCWWQVYIQNRRFFHPFHPIRIELLERFTRRAFREKMGTIAWQKFNSAGWDLTIIIAYVYAAFLYVKYARR